MPMSFFSQFKNWSYLKLFLVRVEFKVLIFLKWLRQQVFYRSCMDSVNHIEKIGNKPLKEIIRKVGGWNLTKSNGQNSYTFWKSRFFWVPKLWTKVRERQIIRAKVRSSGYHTLLAIGRLWVWISSYTTWKWCQSHARIDSCTQSWFIQ